MGVLHVRDLAKCYGDLVAVDHLSFEVQPGEVFGLLGPNGAGKTSTIRMVMDIMRPDSGSIEILGGRPSVKTMERIGYMPEERGLYPNLKLLDCLVYLAELKGMPHHKAQSRGLELLRRVELQDHARHNVSALSKGMQQKAQFVTTIMHEPDILILDEPFQGLDPVNTEMIKAMITELRQRNVAIVMSTHIMSQVEQMCDRILLIDHGRAKLYGPLREIKARYGQHMLLVQLENGAEMPVDLAGVQRLSRQGHQFEVFLADQATPTDVLAQLVQRRVSVTRFEVGAMPLDQIFIAVVTHNHKEPAA